MNGIMDYLNILKDLFIQNFTTTMSMSRTILTLILAFAFAILLYFAYMLTSRDVIYSKRFNSTMALIIPITASLILSMQANVVLSLGMVGALSIVRFRTAIKEPRDLLFLFWAISLGIILGGGLYAVAFWLTLTLLIGLLVFDRLPGQRVPFLLVLNLQDAKAEDAALEALRKRGIQARIRSRSVSIGKTDLVLSLRAKDERAMMDELAQIDGVTYVNLLAHDGETQL